MSNEVVPLLGAYAIECWWTVVESQRRLPDAEDCRSRDRDKNNVQRGVRL